MTWLSAIIMGLVQGIAEVLPLSSSGHLAIAEHLLNMQGASEIPQFYDVLLHLGTLVAVFIAYWDEIYDMIVEFFAGVGDLVHHTTPRVVPPARRMILLVIVGTLPLFVMVPFRRFFEGLRDNMYFIGGALLFTGVLLFVSDRVRRGGKTEKTARLADALVVGIGQAIALGCDTFVTSDLSYHEFLDTKALNLIDAGHFPTENVICPVIAERLQAAFPHISVALSAAHDREIIQYCIKKEK